MLNFKIDHQFLQTQQLSFQLPVGDLKTYYLTEDAELEFEDDFYFISKLGKARDDNTRLVSVEANATWYRLGERKYVGNFTINAVSPELGLQLILDAAVEDNLEWTIGLISSSPKFFSMDAKDASYLDLIYQWAKICGCEVTFDTKRYKVNMRETIGGNYGLSFRWNRNLKTIERVSIPPQVTRLYPYGRLDLTIVGQNGGLEYLENYDYYTAQGLTEEQARTRYRKDYTYSDDSFIDDASLYTTAVARLAILAQPTITYTCKVADLSDITGYAESRFQLGDYCVVDDEVLGISVITRITRYVRYPYEPHRNEITLSFNPVSLPDPRTSTGRSENKSWELFVAKNIDTPRFVGIGRTVLHRLPLIANQEAEWILTYSLKGTCSVSGTLQVTFMDDILEETFLPTLNIPCVAGQEFFHTITIADELVPVQSFNFVVRAEMTGDVGAVDIAANETNLWVMARGVISGQNPAYTNSIRFDYTGAVQLFRVPDDVFEIIIEAHGGGASSNNGGKGEKIVCTLDVIAGDRYDVYIGGQTVNGSGGAPIAGAWPNGGASGGTGSGGGNGDAGGGSTDIRPEGTDATQVKVMAGAGGGFGEPSFSSGNPTGGDAGYIQGDWGRTSAGGDTAEGGSQTEGGNTGAGGDGAFNLGGAGTSSGNPFDFGSGGGGGGWYGGEGGNFGPGGNGQTGGGGGSSHTSADVYDLEYQDGENAGNGYMIISWADPVVA